ncbi:biotin transport system substrate-specific component [Clostridium acidisoli DSM 12555]|uniref:Biotin transporter n=1 Tax=Clostridium acidisoli DSM 12555 TaxID=1121291 RepID=A0A1W1XZM2_9CLOT|nr:biotin transport system substrate-specific component [Clostridium acidisoli DSM 12555]
MITLKINTRSIIMAALFAALTAIGALITIPIGPVPITLQDMFPMLAGLILGAEIGALSQIVYILIGLIGLPVLAGGTGGINSVFTPSFGYLIGFLLAAFVIGKISGKIKKLTFTKAFLLCIVGMIVIYAVGIPYLYLILNNFLGKKVTIQYAIKVGFVLFIPGDIIKTIIVSIIASNVIPLLKKNGIVKVNS